ncbi:uncharacterized protein LOC142777415 isoform X8 [Rhipicephalus microplus]|uniref:uncharacterized protein LOC142777415 isoform X8 n=1 Tax=Rhipicephalus microplus TaxID=6941 RepID=UPI003F6D9364
MRMPGDCFSPELFTKMAKKIAQLTKVVYTLNSRAEDQETLMLAMKQLHEEDMKRVTRDANDKMVRCQNQVSRQVALLEGALVRERLERFRLEGELRGHRHQQQLEPAGQLVSLCAEMREASVLLRSKLDAFDRLQLHVALAMEGLPANPDPPGMTSSVIVHGQVENDCILRKNDFLRDHCDKLAEENRRMRVNFEGDLAQLRSFYEEKLHSSRRLQLANDASLHASRVDALLLELAHSEQQLDRYCKEARALSDELEKRDKSLKVMDDQASGSQQALLQLTGRLKQSEAALNQLKMSCALYKQDSIAKRDRIASLEATSREQQARIEHLEAEVLQVAPTLARCEAQQKKLADTQEILESTKKELQAKQQKLEDLERRLNSCRDECKCLKLIQAQVKESLSEAEHKIYVLHSELDQKAEALSKKDQEIRSLQISIKDVKEDSRERASGGCTTRPPVGAAVFARAKGRRRRRRRQSSSGEQRGWWRSPSRDALRAESRRGVRSSGLQQRETMSDTANAASPAQEETTQDIQEHEDSVMKMQVMTKNCGKLTVHVQGDMDNLEKKAVFLTVHDIGNNHSSFQDFVDHPCMAEIKQRSVFIHVDVPGQEDNATELPSEFNFPTIQMMGEDLISVLDHLKINLVVGFGEGAGANILVRFALAHPSRVLGLILMHLVSTGVGMMEYFKDKIMNWKLQNVGMNPSAEQYLVLHKFGAEQLEMVDNKERLISDYTEKLKKQINPRNLKRYVESYMNRKDISGLIEANLKSMDVLLVTGSKAAHAQAVQNMYARMDKQKTSLLKVDAVGDVLQESPEKLAQSLLLFVKGLGFLTSITLPGVERQRTFSGGDHKMLGAVGRRHTLSMEDYDIPRTRRTSLTAVQK